jgi:hypothetical protein
MTTFGIELEIVNDGRYTREQIAAAIRANGVNCHAEGYSHNTPRGWKIVTDGSVSGSNGVNGFEIVSPILDPRNGTGCYDQIMAVCNALNSLGIKVNKSCGFHVHLHVANMTPKAVAAFCARYIRNEHFIDQSMPKSRRASENRYTRSNIAVHVPTDPAAYMTAVNNTIARLRTVTTFDDLRTKLHNGQDRYVKLNMHAFSRQGTIEVRHGAGTTNAEKVCMWVRFLLSLLAMSQTSPYVRSMTHYCLTADRAWGSFWRLNDRPAAMWILRRMKKFMTEEGLNVLDSDVPVAA